MGVPVLGMLVDPVRTVRLASRCVEEAVSEDAGYGYSSLPAASSRTAESSSSQQLQRAETQSRLETRHVTQAHPHRISDQITEIEARSYRDNAEV